uniref:Transposase Tc1-like domain-containing protein n=1 Tax=Denticeps clupeoides TaxID=299321 RepID=A0AAY4AVE3_9TELE
MGKTCDLSEFDRGMIVGARRSGCSISQAADLLGFSRSTVSRVYREWRERQKTSSQRHYCGRKHLVDELGQVRLARIIEANRNATTAQITSLYNEGEKKGISQRTTRRALKQMGYSKELENQNRDEQKLPLPVLNDRHFLTIRTGKKKNKNKG